MLKFRRLFLEIKLDNPNTVFVTQNNEPKTKNNQSKDELFSFGNRNGFGDGSLLCDMIICDMIAF